ncbi:MAG: polyamine ABC transporter substrate-binding protein [Pararhizobium sp.]
MKRRDLLAFGAALIAGGVLMANAVPAAKTEDRVVNIYNWSDYIDPQILKDFTQKTGIKVVYDTFDSNEVLETKLLAGSTGYDIVVPTATFLARQIQAGVFQKLDKSKLPNLKNMDPEIMKRLAKYDPDNAHAINYMWGTTGLGINVDMVTKALGPDFKLNTWDLVFKPEVAKKLAGCGIYMLDTSDELVPAALNYLGLNPDSNSPDDIKKAEDLLLKVRPYVKKFHSSEYINALANGDICVAVGWSGDVLQARDRAKEAKQGVKIRYIIPKEGALMWFDNMAIPADAKHVEEAHAFLNYIMEPEVIAKASDFVNYANGNAASKKYVDKSVLDDPEVYPDKETMALLYTTSPKDQRTQRLLTRTWTTVVTGQ